MYDLLNNLGGATSQTNLQLVSTVQTGQGYALMPKLPCESIASNLYCFLQRKINGLEQALDRVQQAGIYLADTLERFVRIRLDNTLHYLFKKVLTVDGAILQTKQNHLLSYYQYLGSQHPKEITGREQNNHKVSLQKINLVCVYLFITLSHNQSFFSPGSSLLFPSFVIVLFFLPFFCSQSPTILDDPELQQQHVGYCFSWYI